MFSLKSDNHLEDLVKILLGDNIFSDIVFVADSSSFYGHSSLMYKLLPSLANLVCEGCKVGHEKVVILLPGVSGEFLELALKKFYLNGDVTDLSFVLNGNNLEKHVEISTSTIQQHEDPESATGKTNNSDNAIIANNARKQSKQVENSTITELEHMESKQTNDKEIIKQNDYVTEMLLDEGTDDVLESDLQNIELFANDSEIKVEIVSKITDNEPEKGEDASECEYSIEEVEGSNESVSSISGLLRQIVENLRPIIASGLDPKIRSSVMTSLVQKKELTLSQSLAVIDCVNLKVHKILGNVNLDASFCQCLSMILKEHIPETFTHRSDLPGKISTCYSNKFLASQANWLTQFRANFKKNIIDKSSYKVLEAVESNAVIESLRERREIRNTIINTIVTHLRKIFNGDESPSKKDVREIAAEMTFIYPALFSHHDGSSYGKRGVEGFVDQIKDRLRDKKRQGIKDIQHGKVLHQIPIPTKFESFILNRTSTETSLKVQQESRNVDDDDISTTDIDYEIVNSTLHTNSNQLNEFRKHIRREII